MVSRGPLKPVPFGDPVKLLITLFVIPEDGILKLPISLWYFTGLCTCGSCL